MRHSLESPETPGTWRAPLCRFAIEWPVDVLEQIRLAGVDAFLSLPHGGMEIGGVLYGRRDTGHVRILAARPLECEHALGPTFALSERDQSRLAELAGPGCRDLRAQGLEPVGWYHSHTRSEIFLSAPDLEIHNRYFPEPWQVALVVRPHIMHPVRAGFFFREADGSIHAESSYCEFLLEPPKKTAPAEPASVAAPAEPAEPAKAAGVAAPAATLNPSRPSWGSIWWMLVTLMLALTAGLLTVKKDPLPSVSLAAYDINGQLQIHWDRAAEPVANADVGALEIMDGGAKTVVILEKQQLRSGTVSYARDTARVDLRLALYQPGGKKDLETTSFIDHPRNSPAP